MKISEDLKKNAWEMMKSKIIYTDDLDEAKKTLENRSGIVEVPWCGENDCGLKLEELTNSRVLGSPYDSARDVSNKSCVVCKKPAKDTLRLAKTY